MSSSSCWNSPRPLPEGVNDKLQDLQPHQFDEAADLIVNAFIPKDGTETHEPYPQWAWIFESLLIQKRGNSSDAAGDCRKDQRKAFKWLLRRNLMVQYEHDKAMKQKSSLRCAFRQLPDQEKPQMICFFILKSITMMGDNEDEKTNKKNTSKKMISTWAMIRHGLLWLPILFGWQVFYRLLLAKSYYKEILQQYVSLLQEREPDRHSCCNLEQMVVHPSMHGKGMGSYFLKKALVSINSSDCDKKDTICFIETQTELNARFYQKLGSTILAKVSYPLSPDITSWVMEYRHAKK